MANFSLFFTRKINVFVFTTIMVFLAGCSKGTIDSKLFYGTWQNTRGDGTITITLSKESWVGLYTDGGGTYTVDQLSWVPAVNDDPATKGDYPLGYYITGTVSQLYNITDIKLGEQRTFIIYLNKGKTSFLRKMNNLSDYVFTKIE